jgi:eukaryotic-like serine/threonine-protein kinase
VLAEDDDLVDPDVIDPDLVEADVDGGTRTDLGLPPQPTAATPEEVAAASTAPAASAAPAAAAPAAPPSVDLAAAATELDAEDEPPTDPRDGIGADDPEDEPTDVEPVETGSEATVTIPTGDPPGRPVAFGPADQFGPTVALTPFDETAGSARAAGATRVGAPSRTGEAGRAGRQPAYGAYGSAPADSEPPTQMIAPLPFGGPQGTISEQQPARAFRAQPPAAVLGFPDERPPADRRKRTLGALLIVIVLVAVILLGGALLIRGLRGNDDGARGTGTPTGASSSLGPAKIPTGFTAYEGTGFTVAVPSNWPPAEQRAGVVDAKEATTTRFIRLIAVNSTATAFEQLSAAERQFDADPSYGDYQRVQLQRVDYRGLDAADWEFTFTLKGTPRHVLYRGIVTGGKTYGLYLSTPEADWARSKNVFQVAADTFRTS